jgi:hypothetical protein
MDLRTHIATFSGRAEVVLTVPNRQISFMGLEIKDLDHPMMSGFIRGLKDDEIPYSKLTIFAFPEKEESWVARGFLKEGVVLGYFLDGKEAHVWAKYGDEQREFALRDAAQDRLLGVAGETSLEQPLQPKNLECRIAAFEDAASIEEFYHTHTEENSSSFDRHLIRQAIVTGTCRFHLLLDARDNLAAVAVAEIDHGNQVAAIRDCNIRPDLIAQEAIPYLVLELERSLKRDCGIMNLYALVGADEIEMNCVFVTLRYVFTGRLVNHIHLHNGWTSMNLWCLPDAPANRFSEHQPR